MATPTFGEWLKRTRQSRRISQERLAELAPIDRGHLSRIENNRIDLPQWETRQRLHRVLGTSEEDLRDAGILDAEGAIRAFLRKVGARVVFVDGEPILDGLG